MSSPPSELVSSSFRHTTLHSSRISAFSPSSIWLAEAPARSLSSCSRTSNTWRALTTASGRPFIIGSELSEDESCEVMDWGILIRFVGVMGLDCPLLGALDSSFAIDDLFDCMGGGSVTGDCSPSSCWILLSRERTYWMVWSLMGFGWRIPSSWNKSHHAH